MLVAPAASAAPCQHIALTAGHILNDLLGLSVPDDRAFRHSNDKVFAVLAGTACAGAVCAVLGHIFAFVTEVHQGGQVPVGDQHDAAATAAVTAVRAAVGHVFFPVEGHRPVAAVAGADGDPGSIYKGSCHIVSSFYQWWG